MPCSPSEPGDDGGMRLHRLTLFVVPAALTAAVLLAGCVPTDTEDPGAIETPTPTASATPSPTATTAPTNGPVGLPITVSCEQLLPADVVYAYNENFTLQNGYVPAAGTLGAEALRQNGLACAWVHNSNGQLIELSVANLPEPEFTTLANETFTSSNSVPTYGVEGYFLAEGGVGVAQAFSTPYWLVMSSPTFFEPGDAAPLVQAALTALG